LIVVVKDAPAAAPKEETKEEKANAEASAKNKKKKEKAKKKKEEEEKKAKEEGAKEEDEGLTAEEKIKAALAKRDKLSGGVQVKKSNVQTAKQEIADRKGKKNNKKKDDRDR
jgi:hypothetical protein